MTRAIKYSIIIYGGIMKILITSDWYEPVINGVVTSVKNLYTELTNMGHEVRILTLSRSNVSKREGHVYYIKSFSLNVYPNARASLTLNDDLIDELAQWKPDVIHSQCEFFTYTYAQLVAFKANVPIVHTYHTMYEHYSDYVLKNKVLSRYIISFMSKTRLRDSVVIIAPTNKVKNKLFDYEIQNEIKVIPSGLDLSKFDIKFTDEDKVKIKDEYNIPQDSTVLLSLGRLGKEKNIEELLSAFKHLISEENNYYLVIVGGGPYMDTLEKEISRLDIGHRTILTGMIDPEKIPYIYKMADCFVSASQSETQGLTYIEALSNGLPEVCKYDYCLDNVLIDGYNGYFFETAEDFVEKINALFINPETYKEMSDNALKKSKEYSKEIFARSVMDVYKLAINLYKANPGTLNKMKQTIDSKVKTTLDDIKNTLEI